MTRSLKTHISPKFASEISGQKKTQGSHEAYIIAATSVAEPFAAPRSKVLDPIKKLPGTDGLSNQLSLAFI